MDILAEFNDFLIANGVLKEYRSKVSMHWTGIAYDKVLSLIIPKQYFLKGFFWDDAKWIDLSYRWGVICRKKKIE